MKKVILDFASQLNRDFFTIYAFLQDKTINPRKDASNLPCEITSAAASTALAPLETDSVVLTYTAKSLQTGTIVEKEASKGLKSNARTTLPVWKILLPLLCEKKKATVYVPSRMGYGAYGKTGVAPYPNLIYDKYP